MEKRNIGIIATIVSTMICGCPGISFLLCGGLFAFTGNLDDPSAYGITTEGDPFTVGIFFLGLGFFMVIIPIVIAVIAFWPRRKTKIENFDGPIPPAL